MNEQTQLVEAVRGVIAERERALAERLDRHDLALRALDQLLTARKGAGGLPRSAGAQSMIDDVTGAIVDLIRRSLRPLHERIALLEQQPFTYDGPHEAGREYRKGTFVTLSGSLWHCNRPTKERPGESDAWTLAVKHGRDAR
jgi:hypothetical protein